MWDGRFLSRTPFSILYKSSTKLFTRLPPQFPPVEKSLSRRPLCAQVLCSMALSVWVNERVIDSAVEGCARGIGRFLMLYRTFSAPFVGRPGTQGRPCCAAADPGLRLRWPFRPFCRRLNAAAHFQSIRGDLFRISCSRLGIAYGGARVGFGNWLRLEWGGTNRASAVKPIPHSPHTHGAHPFMHLSHDQSRCNTPCNSNKEDSAMTNTTKRPATLVLANAGNTGHHRDHSRTHPPLNRQKKSRGAPPYHQSRCSGQIPLQALFVYNDTENSAHEK